MSEQNIIPPPDGAISDEDFADYMGVIGAALRVHYDRERVRQGLWKDYGAKDQVNTIKIKVDRIVRSFDILSGIDTSEDVKLRRQILANMIEELYDVINYANFAVRQLG